jgi:hypothetical protein
MLVDYESSVARYLEFIKNRQGIYCTDAQTYQDIIDCIKNSGKKRETYFQAFKNIINRIRREWGHLIAEGKKTCEHDVGAGLVMNVFFDIKELGKWLKKTQIIITKIEIAEYHFSRKALLSRYP